MLLHKDNKFIYNNVASVKIPNNVYLDPCPDPCPVEGMVLYTEDMCAKADINFLTTEKEAKSFLKEGIEVYDSFQCLKPISRVSTNGVKGYSTIYTTSRYIYEEYVFALEDTLLNICIEQRRDKEADLMQYAQFIDELLAGVQMI